MATHNNKVKKAKGSSATNTALTEFVHQVTLAVHLCLFRAQAVRDVVLKSPISYSFAFLALELFLGAFFYPSTGMGIVSDILITLAVLALIIAAIHGLARMLGSSRSIVPYFKVSMYPSILSLSYIPQAFLMGWVEATYNLIFVLWSLAIMVFVTKEYYNLSWKRTAVLFALLLVFLLVVFALVTLVSALYVIATGTRYSQGFY